MKLSTANNVNRGHRSGHYLLVLYNRRILLKYKILTISFEEDTIVEEKIKPMSLRDFSKISSALWDFGQSRAGKALYG